MHTESDRGAATHTNGVLIRLSSSRKHMKSCDFRSRAAREVSCRCGTVAAGAEFGWLTRLTLDSHSQELEGRFYPIDHQPSFVVIHRLNRGTDEPTAHTVFKKAEPFGFEQVGIDQSPSTRLSVGRYVVIKTYSVAVSMCRTLVVDPLKRHHVYSHAPIGGMVPEPRPLIH